MAKHAYCIKSSQLWQGEAPYIDLMYSFIILFDKISTSIWEKKSCLLELWRYVGINHESDKIEYYVTGNT